MSDLNIKDAVKIPEGLDNAVLKGIERGRNDKQFQKDKKKINGFRKTAIAAGLALGVTMTAGVINPEIVSAIPGLGKVFESFNTTLFGEPTERFKEAAQVIGEVKEDNGVSVMLDEVILDDNILMMALTVESDFLKGYEGLNEGDFFYLDGYIFVNGEVPTSMGSKVRIIDENKGAVILSTNIAEMNIGDTADIKLKVSGISRGYENKDAEMEFALKADKLPGGNRIVLKDVITIGDNSIESAELVTSKLTNTLLLKGKTAPIEPGSKEHSKAVFFDTEYMVKDNTGKYFRTEKTGSLSYEGDMFIRLEIKGDLSNSESIQVIPKITDNAIIEEVDGLKLELLQCTGNEGAEYTSEIISRPASEAELKAGYALDKVSYLINVEENKEFNTLQELIGTSIPVNSTENVLIQNIEAGEKGTKVTFKIEGSYDYRSLTQMVIFDENMKDVSRREGQSVAAIENEQDGIYSMTLDKVNPVGKYKIAIPRIP
ncbi:MAG: DUF4179 domain-containing protein, partial [Clostridium sp.]